MENFSAAVQYEDLKGGISIDEGDLKGLRDFASDNGINTKQYFPVGMDFYIGENGLASTTIIAVDVVANNIPGDYDNIKDFIEHNNPISVVKFDINKDINEFFKYTKRVSIVFERKGFGLYGKEVNETNGEL
jgi:hypothetical protein